MPLNQLIQQRYGVNPVAEPRDSVASNLVLETLLNHRSCRNFEAEAVPDELLDVLLAAAFSTPSKSDLQQRCVIRIRDPEKQARLATHSPPLGWVAEAPLLLIWCGDSRRIRRLSSDKGREFANDHLDAFMNAAVDAGIAMQGFISAAESVGLGCCPLSELRNQIDQLSAILELPEHVFPVAGLAVGFPAEPPPISMRLPLSVTVHEGVYDDSDMLQQVADYDQRRLASEQAEDSALQGTENQWSEKRTRQYATPARADFGRYIREQGFNLS